MDARTAVVPKSPLLADVEKDLASPDWMVRKEGVGRVAGLLGGAPEPAIAAALVDHLDRLAGDDKWEIRTAVAHALAIIEGDLGEAILERLAADANHYVRRAAEKGLKKRRAITRELRLQDERTAAAASRLDRIADRFSPEFAARLREISREMCGILAGGAAHDIRNIMNALRQWLAILERELNAPHLSREACQDAVAKAQERSRAILAIARDLNLFAENRKPILRREKVHDMVMEALETVRDRYRGSEPPSRIQPEVSIPRHLAIDAPRTDLVRAISNVIRNAYEAIKVEGSVTITAKVEDSHLVLRIADNGCGMTPEVAREAFIAWKSTKKGKSGSGENTGMGLTHAQQVVEEVCRGRIALESTPGAGTTATITVPVDQPKEESNP